MRLPSPAQLEWAARNLQPDYLEDFVATCYYLTEINPELKPIRRTDQPGVGLNMKGQKTWIRKGSPLYGESDCWFAAFAANTKVVNLVKCGLFPKYGDPAKSHNN